MLAQRYAVWSIHNYINDLATGQSGCNIGFGGVSKLSTDCVHASSVNMFKNKIDKYLAKAGYT